MSSTQRVFYVIYLPEGEFRNCVDAMRVIVKPNTQHSAHITVRGPYQEAADMRVHNEQIRGSIVRVADVGSFSTARQNTIFLHCSCPALLSVWDKPDYAYNPHITIYDGESAAFAEAMNEIIEQVSLRYSFRVRELEPLHSGKTATPLLKDRLDVPALTELFGEWPSTADLDGMDDTQRLEWIKRITDHLACNDRSFVLA